MVLAAFGGCCGPPKLSPILGLLQCNMAAQNPLLWCQHWPKQQELALWGGGVVGGSSHKWSNCSHLAITPKVDSGRGVPTTKKLWGVCEVVCCWPLLARPHSPQEQQRALGQVAATPLAQQQKPHACTQSQHIPSSVQLKLSWL